MSRVERPSTTVVVPAFNAEGTIEACVRSLVELRYPAEALELVVVDNGSSDGTRAVLERFADRIAIVEEPRRGPAAARNAGIRRARGEVVAFTDADCTVAPDWLDELVEPLDDPEVGIVGGAILAREGANAAERYGETIHDHRSALLVWRPPYAITMNWASRRAVLDEVGLFDEAFRRCEDIDLSYRIGRAGYSLVYQPSAVVRHRNEQSLPGLSREGWQHGFHAVAVHARHSRFIAEALKTLPAPAQRSSGPSRYELAFRAGKAAGGIAGKAWYRLEPRFGRRPHAPARAR
jgi:GT2 family glycosyltransferase